MTETAPTIRFPAALDIRRRCVYEAGQLSHDAVTAASGACERDVRKRFGLQSDHLTLGWSEWGVDISSASLMKVLGGTSSERVAKVKADLCGTVRVGHSEVKFDIAISRSGSFFSGADSVATLEVLDGVDCCHFVDDLFRLPIHDAALLESLNRREIDWFQQDLDPEITVSLFGHKIQPTMDIHQAIRDCNRARELAKIGGR